MIIVGRCRGNAVQLTDYLLNNKENQESHFITVSGTARPTNLKLSLLEMSLTSEISGKTSKGLYHAQLSPRIEEAAEMSMSFDQQKRMVEIFIEKMGMPKDTKWALVEHHKDNRIHYHAVFERYNHETRTMWDDDKNWKKHNSASRAMEIEFGWKLTYEKTNILEKDIKDYIWDLWHETKDGKSFVDAMAKAGFEVTQGIDNRPYEFVDEHGVKFNLTKQIAGVRQKEVSERLNPIRKTLRQTPEVCQERRLLAQKEKSHQSDKTHEMSESQDLMIGMKNYYNRADKSSEAEKQEDGKATTSYSFSFKVTPPPLPQAFLEVQSSKSDNKRDLSGSQDLAAAMLKKQQDEKEAMQRIDALEVQSDKSNNKRDLSDSQDLAAAMLKKQQQEKEVTPSIAANDNKRPVSKYSRNKEDSVFYKKSKYSRTDHRERDDDELSRERRRERGNNYE